MLQCSYGCGSDCFCSRIRHRWAGRKLADFSCDRGWMHLVRFWIRRIYVNFVYRIFQERPVSTERRGYWLILIDSKISRGAVFVYRNVLTAWSSGTGGAGFFGSMTYAALIGIGLTPKETLFLLLIVPVVLGIRLVFLAFALSIPIAGTFC